MNQLKNYCTYCLSSVYEFEPFWIKKNTCFFNDHFFQKNAFKKPQNLILKFMILSKISGINLGLCQYIRSTYL